MAELLFPDIVGAGQRGYAFGTQMRQNREEEERRSGLAQLVSEGYSTPPEQQQSHLAKMALLSPQAAAAQEEQFQSKEERELKKLVGAAQYLENARKQNNPAAIQGAWNVVRPYVAREFPQGQFPEQWDDAKMAPILYEVLAKGGGVGAAGGVQSTKIGDDGYFYTVDRQGQWTNSGIKAAPNIKVMEQPGAAPYGVVTGSGQPGAIVPFGAGSGQPQAPSAPLPSNHEPQFSAGQGGTAVNVSIEGINPQRQQRIANMASTMRAAGYGDDAVMQYIERELNGAAPAPPAPAPQPVPQPSPQGGQLPPRLDYQRGGSIAGPSVGPQRIPLPEETAAAVEAAKQRAQLDFLPEQERIKTQAEIDRKRGVAQVEAEVERDAAAPKRIARYEAALKTAANVGVSVGRAMRLIGSESTGFVGARLRNVEGSPAYNLASEIETIKANLGFDRLQEMRDNSPTGGALGQVAIQELIALQSTVANLDPDQSGEQLQANLQRIQQHYDNWRSAVERSLADERSQGKQGSGAATDPLGIL